MSSFRFDDGGDEEMLEIRGLLAYIERQDEMLKRQASELQRLRDQLQEGDMPDIEQQSTNEPTPTAIKSMSQAASQTDETSESYLRQLEQHEDALNRAGCLAIELAQSKERADLLEEDLITTRQQLQACQEKLREMILGHGNSLNQEDGTVKTKPVLHRFRQRRHAAEHQPTLKAFFMRTSTTSPDFATAQGSDVGSVQTMPILGVTNYHHETQPDTIPNLIVQEEQDALELIEPSTIDSAPSHLIPNANEGDATDRENTFRFAPSKQRTQRLVANVSLDEEEDDAAGGITDRYEDENSCGRSAYSDDERERSNKSSASSNENIIEKLDAAIEDPRPWKQDLKQRNQASKVIIIQRSYRSYAAKKQEAVLIVQAWWRMTFQRVQYEHHRAKVRRHQAAVTLQCFYRTFQSRERFKFLRSTVLVEAKWRSYVQRTKYKQLRRAAVLLQAHVRRIQATGLLRTLYEQRFASTLIEKHVRGFLLRRDWVRTKDLAIRLVVETNVSLAQRDQNGGKELLEPVLFKMHHQTALQAARHLIVVTSSCPFLFGYATNMAPTACLVHPLWKMVERNVMVVIIQKTWRRHNQQRRWEARRQNAVIIQTAFRRHQKHHIYLVTLEKIIVLQSFIRSLLARKVLDQLQQEKIATTREKASTKIQSCVKRFYQRRHFLVSRDAVMRIQRRMRVHVARGMLVQLRNENLAARMIQIWYGLVHRRNRYRLALLSLATTAEKADATEPRWLRCSLVPQSSTVEDTQQLAPNSESSNSIKALSLNVLIDQSYEYVVEEEPETTWEESDDCWDVAAILVNTFFHCLNKRTKHEAARVIQRCWRHRVAEKAKLSSAAHWIQCYWRERLRSKRRAAQILQKAWRRRISIKTKAAVTIQSWWCEYAAARSNSASLIQMIWRGAMVRQYYSRYQAVSAQVESFLNGQTSAKDQTRSRIRQGVMHETKRYIAAVRIQRWWLDLNGFIARDSTDETIMIIEFDPNLSGVIKDLAVDKSMSFDQSFTLESLATRRRQWKERKPTVWKTIREKSSVPIPSKLSYPKMNGYVSVEEQDRYHVPVREKDKYTPASVMVASDEEENEVQAKSCSDANRANDRKAEERKPVLANFPTLKIPLKTKKRLKKWTSSLRAQNRVDLMDPKVQRRLAEIDSLNWATFDFRDPESSPELPVPKSVTPRTREKTHRHSRKKSPRSIPPIPSYIKTSPSELSLGSKRGNLSPLHESPAEVSNGDSNESFLFDLRDSVSQASGKENATQFTKTFSRWSSTAERYEASGLADVLGKVEAFRVDAKKS